MDIMQAFRNATGLGGAPTPPVNQHTQMSSPGNIPPNGPVNDPIAINTPAPAASPVPTPAPSPMADFSKIWDTPVVDPTKPVQPNPNDPVKFNIDPAKVQEAVKQMDFTKAISPEIMAKIAAGGPEASSAMIVAMQAMVGEAVTKTMIANAGATERALELQRTNLQATMPDLVRTHVATNAIREANPLAVNPATKPVYDMLSAQFMQQFPQASPAELAAQVTKYMSSMAAEAVKAAPDYVAPPAPNAIPKGQTDWGIFIDPTLAH